MTTAIPLTPQSVEASIEAIQALSVVPGLLETVCQVTEMRFAAVARVTDDRWTACAVADHMGFGLKPGGDLELKTTICDEIRQHGQAVIFGSASAHPVFSTHHTPRIYGLESYISVPIFTAGGAFFGTLCAIDSVPRDFNEGTVLATMQLFARLIESQLALEDRAILAEQELRAERDMGVLREQFLSVVGHDLRSPLQGAKLATELLEPMVETERGQRLVHNLATSLNGMASLIADIMDLARGRLGGGVPLTLEERPDVQCVIQEVVDEFHEARPETPFIVEGTIEADTRFDERRLRQLVAKLLDNALFHGDAAQPIRLCFAADETGIDVQVINQGAPIPDDALPLLFEPFARSTSQRPRPGLGLGLYIASEIAKGHGGKLTAKSSEGVGTVFTLWLPRAVTSH
jgi:signal transduction histidine kinase